MESIMTDDDLVIRARGDSAAFAVLYDRYYPLVMRYCLRRLFVRAVAEDVVSEVFLSIAAHLSGFEGTTETEFRRWMFRIASNAVNAYLRQTRRREAILQAAAQRQSLPGASGSSEAASAIERLDWPVVYQAILELDAREQTILSLRFFADLSHDEIGTIIGTSAGAVRTALSRVLHGLRVRFGVQSTTTTVPKGTP
jgi:RNA polymerase sigma-70 factor (ECF subfamily)